MIKTVEKSRRQNGKDNRNIKSDLSTLMSGQSESEDAGSRCGIIMEHQHRFRRCHPSRRRSRAPFSFSPGKAK